MSRKSIKIYINNIPLVFEEDYDPDSWNKYHHFLAHRDDATIDRIIKDAESILNPKKRMGFCFIPRSYDGRNMIEALRNRYNYIEAAGGLVLNEQRKVLMINRLGYWDLPKGKIEKDESPRKAAIREIKEECGIGKLKIIEELPSTYHVYEMKGKKYLKRTYWFMMTCSDDTKPVPQVEENIDEVRWMSKTRMKGINSKNTYGSILEVLSNLKK